MLDPSLHYGMTYPMAMAVEVYQPLLPGAIQRFAGSQKLIQTVNSQLSQQMTPGSSWSHDHWVQRGPAWSKGECLAWCWDLTAGVCFQ